MWAFVNEFNNSTTNLINSTSTTNNSLNGSQPTPASNVGNVTNEFNEKKHYEKIISKLEQALVEANGVYQKVASLEDQLVSANKRIKELQNANSLHENNPKGDTALKVTSMKLKIAETISDKNGNSQKNKSDLFEDEHEVENEEDRRSDNPLEKSLLEISHLLSFAHIYHELQPISNMHPAIHSNPLHPHDEDERASFQMSSKIPSHDPDDPTVKELVQKHQDLMKSFYEIQQENKTLTNQVQDLTNISNMKSMEMKKLKSSKPFPTSPSMGMIPSMEVSVEDNPTLSNTFPVMPSDYKHMIELKSQNDLLKQLVNQQKQETPQWLQQEYQKTLRLVEIKSLENQVLSNQLSFHQVKLVEMEQSKLDMVDKLLKSQNELKQFHEEQERWKKEYQEQYDRLLTEHRSHKEELQLQQEQALNESKRQWMAQSEEEMKAAKLAWQLEMKTLQDQWKMESDQKEEVYDKKLLELESKLQQDVGNEIEVKALLSNQLIEVQNELIKCQETHQMEKLQWKDSQQTNVQQVMNERETEKLNWMKELKQLQEEVERAKCQHSEEKTSLTQQIQVSQEKLVLLSEQTATQIKLLQQEMEDKDRTWIAKEKTLRDDNEKEKKDIQSRLQVELNQLQEKCMKQLQEGKELLKGSKAMVQQHVVWNVKTFQKVKKSWEQLKKVQDENEEKRLQQQLQMEQLTATLNQYEHGIHLSTIVDDHSDESEMTVDDSFGAGKGWMKSIRNLSPRHVANQDPKLTQPNLKHTESNNGNTLLTLEMMKLSKERSIKELDQKELLERSLNAPRVLLGWQILIETNVKLLEGIEPGIYVVTDTRKNLNRKTEYRLSRLGKEDVWTKLRRSENKSGVQFIPLRKVLSRIDDHGRLQSAQLPDLMNQLKVEDYTPPAALIQEKIAPVSELANPVKNWEELWKVERIKTESLEMRIVELEKEVFELQNQLLGITK